MNEWDLISDFRLKQLLGDGDITYNRILLPYIKRYVNKGMRVLDVGCGVGFGTSVLKKQAIDIIGIDPSKGSIDVARAAFPSVNFYHSSLEKFRYKHKYDCIILNMVLHNVENLDKFIRYVANTLAPDGIIVYTMCHPKYWVPYRHGINFESFDYHLERNYTLPFSTTHYPEAIGNYTYHHRPVEVYREIFKSNNLCELEFKELMPDRKTEKLYPTPWESPRYIGGLLKST